LKLLLDQNISRRILPSLSTHFPSSSHVALENLDTASDEEIWQFAKKNNFIIVTKDSDFEELSIIRGTPPQIIWIKVGNSNNKIISNILASNKNEIERLLLDTGVNCVELYD